MKRWRRDRFPRHSKISLKIWIKALATFRKHRRQVRQKFGCHSKPRSLQLKRAFERQNRGNVYVQGILDAINTVIVKDDSRVVGIDAVKCYMSSPGVDIVITEA